MDERDKPSAEAGQIHLVRPKPTVDKEAILRHWRTSRTKIHPAWTDPNYPEIPANQLPPPVETPKK